MAEGQADRDARAHALFAGPVDATLVLVHHLPDGVHANAPLPPSSLLAVKNGREAWSRRPAAMPEPVLEAQNSTCWPSSESCVLVSSVT